MAFIGSIISVNGLAQLKIPVEGSIFLYDIKADPFEINNLAPSADINLINYMENELILAQIDNNMTIPHFILQINEYTKLAQLFYIFSVIIPPTNLDINSFSKQKLKLMLTLTGDNNCDSMSDPKKFEADILKEYASLLESVFPI